MHVCCGAYEHGLFGGVPRYDNQIKMTFPSRIIVRNKPELMHALSNFPNVRVIVDNHYALLVPQEVPCIIVHHGCAQEHIIRAPNRMDLLELAEAQRSIWQYRASKNTKVISISQFCTDMFTKHYALDYPHFRNILLPHCSEHASMGVAWSYTPRDTDQAIMVLGNFKGSSKGEQRMRAVESLSNGRISLCALSVQPMNLGSWAIQEFEERKARIYTQYDVFLQLSVFEGDSYATLDALCLGMPVVATDTGAFYKDVPEDCFVKVAWDAHPEEVCHAIFEARMRSHELSKKALDYCKMHRDFAAWQAKMREVVLEQN